MNGLFLQGGGAKGAFQAGALKALIEKDIKFEILTGTSIGAVNGGFLFFDRVSQLEKTWIGGEYFNFDNIKKEDIIIDTEEAINLLRDDFKINQRKKGIKKFFVNYVKIENSVISERYVDIFPKSDEEIFKYIRFSSLLPKRKGIKIFEGSYNTKDAIEDFKEDIEFGLYDNMRMDGGIINNIFLEPFIDNKVNKIYMVVLKKNFVVPKYILENYNKDQLVIISPDYDYNATDTLNFEIDFLKKNFHAGYEKAKKIIC